ncbi:hypothetical protein ACFQ0K_05655 [Nocardioides caeni]|uniref:ARB-07466-like C-terminal domain-containing protein n=1 Tax=Nocardioides caeni TaxID=574700 RepID=A0A4S8N8X6_9ACTN|nr:hypothetical protein [Nocardioides caeni]THV12171.1 hypothetical protein E9934_12565 [Nocardioides caeni]
MSHRRRASTARPALLLVIVLVGALGWPTSPAGAAVAGPVPELEPYASYQPQTGCSPRPKPGTVVLARWTVRTFGGRLGSISRACGPGTSEHKEGRAFDWGVNVRSRADRLRVRRFLETIFAPDAAGNRHVRARRMGIMYVIWADRMWSAWDGFRPEPYLSSSCPTVRRCSPTLRHRDHVHVSITRPAARGLTSWFADRL